MISRKKDNHIIILYLWEFNKRCHNNFSGRFSTVQKLDGIQTLEQFNTILKLRILLGISEVERYEQDAKIFAENIFTKGIPEQIVNRFIPNLHLMLEESYNSIKMPNQKG